MAFTLLYIVLIVLVPLLTLPFKSFSEGAAFFWETVRDPRVVASYRLTLGASFAAACVNGVFGFIVAWVLVRYRFPGRRIVDAMVDLPFALPTAVAGIALTTLWRVVLPQMLPAMLTGFALAFARGVGEYGSVIFIAGNLPMRSEIVPLLIMIKLEQYDYPGAAAIALVFLLISFTLLLSVNLLSWRQNRIVRLP